MEDNVDNRDEFKVLIVDDDPINLDILREVLDDEYTLLEAQSGQSALKAVADHSPDLVLLDVMMPGMTGFEVCEVLKSRPEAEDIPVLFLTAKADTEDKLRGFTVGGADYIVKPFEPEEVLARVNTHVKLRKAMRTVKRYNERLEEMLGERTRELINSERQAAFSLMIQGIVHNLRNPLMVINGNSELIKLAVEKIRKFCSGPESIDMEFIMKKLDRILKDVSTINSGAAAMNQMINSMMAKSRSDKSDKLEVIDLNKILQQELEFLNADLKYKHDIRKEIKLSPKDLIIKVVPSEISQVFQNLVRNSIHATWDQKDALISVASGEDDRMVWFTVGDNGPGIPEENLEKIFDPFFTTKPKANDQKSAGPKGTGLGLHTCSELVKSYNGYIKVESDIGFGTKFFISIPKKASGSGIEGEAKSAALSVAGA